MKEKITCFCEHQMEVEVPKVLNLDTHPEKLDDILSGKFLNFTCESCGKLLKPEFELSLTYHGKKLLFSPELDRSKVLHKTEEWGSVDRILIGYPELIDRLTVMKTGLDDEVIEIVKYYIFQKAGGEHIYFQSKDDENLIFHIHGLRAEEVGISRIPLNFYEKVSESLTLRRKDEPFRTILAGPYISAEKVSSREEGE
ncbi:MAG: hypothetical protein KAU17_01540 [Spirochaetales bacterium]|nr:hypothetical protein [Spirochaetales bacterium]